jgi:hypothetical protein
MHFIMSRGKYFTRDISAYVGSVYDNTRDMCTATVHWVTNLGLAVGPTKTTEEPDGAYELEAPTGNGKSGKN